MPSPTQSMVRELVREAGPLSVAEILERVPDWRPPRSKDRRGALRNAIANDQLLANRGDGRYAYLPSLLEGATMRLPVVAAAGTPRCLRVGEEVAVLLWPVDEDRYGEPTASLRLDGGPTVVVTRRHRAWSDAEGRDDRTVLIEPEPPFWDWWLAQRRPGTDALLLRCEEHEAGRFTARAIRGADLDPAAVAASNAGLLDAAGTAMKGTEGMMPGELARRLLARGVYHAEPPPDPLLAVLLAPAGEYIIEMGYRLAYRPDVTPALRRLFADRIEIERVGPDLERLLGPTTGERRDALGEPAAGPATGEDETPREVAAAAGYRIKVRLAWAKQVWRVVEILNNQTLQDLHDAIQDAFGWDDDHLYSFYLSGRFGDRLTSVDRPTGDDWDDPPTADEVRLGEIEPRPGQRLAYRFDLGAQLDHELEVVAVFAAPPEPAPDDFPRIVEAHGAAPPQESREDAGLIIVWELPPEGPEAGAPS